MRELLVQIGELATKKTIRTLGLKKSATIRSPPGNAHEATRTGVGMRFDRDARVRRWYRGRSRRAADGCLSGWNEESTHPRKPQEGAEGAFPTHFRIQIVRHQRPRNLFE